MRGDEDMFIQKDIKQIHDYVRKHTEIKNFPHTGGEAAICQKAV